MYKVIFATIGLLIMGRPVFAQGFGREAERFQNQINMIYEIRDLKIEAANYLAACLTIQQAYDLELQSGTSNKSTRADIRKYCG
jgi:hypothetical protein